MRAVALLERVRNLDRILIRHCRGEERGRKERSKSLLLPNPYLNVTFSVRVFC